MSRPRVRVWQKFPWHDINDLRHVQGLDSASAANVIAVLKQNAVDPTSPTTVVVCIHQPKYHYSIHFLYSPLNLATLSLNSSQLYNAFDQVLLLSQGHCLWSGPGGDQPAETLSTVELPYERGRNAATYLLDFASDPPAALMASWNERKSVANVRTVNSVKGTTPTLRTSNCPPTTFLTQFQVLSAREYKNLMRDKTLFLAHLCVAFALGILCGKSQFRICYILLNSLHIISGGLYFRTATTIAGFQSRIGCLFFLVK
jgi:hypothetical protein